MEGGFSYMDIEEEYDKIYRYCYFKLGHQQLAEDMTQETFLRFLENNTYCEKGKKLRYLYTTAHNLCVDIYRSNLEEPLKEQFLSEGKENEILTGIVIKNALTQLTGEEQEILLLRYVNEVPVSVICKMLDMSRFSLYRKTTKALKQLQDMIREEDFR